MIARRLFLLGAFCLFGQWAPAETIHVAVASNFTAAMKDIAAAFEKASDHRVRLSFGSSGKFYAQIRNGAPFQVFFSADQATPKALQQDGLAVPENRFTYAIGALALWSANPGYLEDGATRLKNGDFRKLALANSRLAPYGLAAVEVLEKFSLKEATAGKWVQGENIAQTYQFVRTGNVDLGFVALSQIMESGHIRGGSTWIVPPGLYTPIRQDAVLLQKGDTSEAARALLHFVRGEKVKHIIRSYGYQTVDAKT